MYQFRPKGEKKLKHFSPEGRKNFGVIKKIVGWGKSKKTNTGERLEPKRIGWARPRDISVTSKNILGCRMIFIWTQRSARSLANKLWRPRKNCGLE